jgi:sec-independent protein translocase protein TatC
MSSPPPRLSILGHLAEMRKHLIRSVIAVGVTTALSFIFYDRIFAVLLYPAGELGLIFTEVTEMISTVIQVCLISGIMLAIPYLTYEFMMFVAPALTPGERRHFYLVLPWTVIMFGVGVVFSYFMLTPYALSFLLGFGGDIATPQIRVSNYVSVVARLLLVSGFVFEMPVVTTFLARIGVVSAEWLARKRKIVIVAAFVVAAILTPPDVFTQIILAVPLIVLYELSIILARVLGRKRTAAGGGVAS